ncbi:hypothetical protein J2T57_001731 [Natronocella acetinitrilica]|uniref:Lipoprotein n=1 Tax=Natronocella acetinitrilica TaxID=414046 RepID=A0AAE3KBB9_9GAMM|nr:hypothetical protein [Natronocella acetinitrilica]MCP1674629.1 hypothetical protein [Natronocella acetinitrilica]
MGGIVKDGLRVAPMLLGMALLVAGCRAPLALPDAYDGQFAEPPPETADEALLREAYSAWFDGEVLLALYDPADLGALRSRLAEGVISTALWAEVSEHAADQRDRQGHFHMLGIRYRGHGVCLIHAPPGDVAGPAVAALPELAIDRRFALLHELAHCDDAFLADEGFRTLHFHSAADGRFVPGRAYLRYQSEVYADLLAALLVLAEGGSVAAVESVALARDLRLLLGDAEHWSAPALRALLARIDASTLSGARHDELAAIARALLASDAVLDAKAFAALAALARSDGRVAALPAALRGERSGGLPPALARALADPALRQALSRIERAGYAH